LQRDSYTKEIESDHGLEIVMDAKTQQIRKLTKMRKHGKKLLSIGIITSIKHPVGYSTEKKWNMKNKMLAL
jgi:hypothetical protein